MIKLYNKHVSVNRKQFIIGYYKNGKDQIEIRQNKYLNNRIEGDHRFIKKITRPMLGFKSFTSARITLKGIEIVNMIRKKQINNKEI